MKRCLIWSLFTANVACATVMNLKVCVIDRESGCPIRSARVDAAFSNPPSIWGGISHDMENEATTDKNGWCSILGRSSSGKCDFEVLQSEKYYRGFGVWNLNRDAHSLPLMPQCYSTTVALYRVVHPIPLFISEVATRSFEDTFEDSNVLCYDLMKDDWMPPKGMGEKPDIEFTRYPRAELGIGTNCAGKASMRTKDLVLVRFLEEGCGILTVKPYIGSGLRVRTAPEAGYSREFRCERIRNEDLSYSDTWGEGVCHCFRIRAKFDGNGKLIDGYYGKIYGGIGLKLTSKPNVKAGGLKFLYYLNTTPLDRNLEYNGKHNLNLKKRMDYSYDP